MNLKEMSDFRSGWIYPCRISGLWSAAVKKTGGLITWVEKTRGCTRVFAPGCTITRSTSRQAPRWSLKVIIFSFWEQKRHFGGRNYHHQKERTRAEMVAPHVHLKIGYFLAEDVMVNQALFSTPNTQNTRHPSWKWPYFKMIPPQKKDNPAVTKEMPWAVSNVRM